MFESSIVEINGITLGVVLRDHRDGPCSFRALHERTIQMNGRSYATMEDARAHARSLMRMGNACRPMPEAACGLHA
ncbi:hypothetical protein IFJ82_02285 [Novacetimonas hansenii]|uniref:DUF1488 family protein n=2 Tax=Novacetimonas hansenii TaxID=436 RepID=A0AAW5ERY3_NOVHA|nr:hypothetical protein [Novacetimonas hansenii]EFG83302.1 hypothetical protein GXY_14173 [Novacetimonas hansenii ATCC 23769]MBL7236812.1 hypothetical protein [Novacetimonas hansenii]MCJ8353065.1 hypothetical protein [Novacetimonas hansenii]PYD73008.1 hypothetical protein CFR74_06585 [Novacetimonas hansenii]QOF95536.1 hypothetical protein IFJ82_02285 [Novacetimonas hansenii]